MKNTVSEYIEQVTSFYLLLHIEVYSLKTEFILFSSSTHGIFTRIKHILGSGNNQFSQYI